MFRARRAVRRTVRRVNRRMFFRFALLEEDVTRIERETGRAADQMSEAELVAAMKKLGIKKLEVDE